MYSIAYHRDLNLLDITWSSLFTAEKMKDYADACRACWAVERFHDGYRLRITLADNLPLPQDTLPVLAVAFVDFPKAGRTAMVTASAVARLQINRVMMEPNLQIFGDGDSALD